MFQNFYVQKKENKNTIDTAIVFLIFISAYLDWLAVLLI